MGSRIARQLAGPITLAAVLAASLVLYSAPGQAWPRCHDEDDACTRYLNVVTHEGSARLSVDRSCRGGWRHRWGRADAHQTIRQWLDAAAARGRGRLCVPLASRVDEIRIASLGGHCGYEGGDTSTPGPDVALRRGRIPPAEIALTGCHARVGDQRFGGIALDFADGYGFGDAYAAGYFYGVYDGFGRRGVGLTGATVWRISEFNTFHYRIEILARGRLDWGRGDDDDD